MAYGNGANGAATYESMQPAPQAVIAPGDNAPGVEAMAEPRGPARAAKRQNRATLRTSDFDVACGHLMVVMAAKIFLKSRHGDTVGYFITARRKRSEEERAALKEAAGRLDALLAAKGITEDELVADFKRWRAGKRR